MLSLGSSTYYSRDMELLKLMINISVVRFRGDKIPNLETSYNDGVGKN